LFAAAAGVLLAAPAAAFSEREAARGNTLFDRAWAAGGTSTAGLGPLFNARSCGECHPRGGRGDPTGPGFVLRLPDDPALGRQLQTASVPGLAPEGRPGFVRETAEVVTLGDGERVELRRPRPDRPGSFRLAPPLRGLGLLARVPRHAVLALADPEDRDGDGVSGRPGPGSFGMTAEQPTLAGQVAEALSLDLGVSTPRRPESAGDCIPAQADCLVRAGTRQAVEAGAEVADALVAYLEALRPGPTTGGPGPEGRGEATFARFGCAACHHPEFTVTADPALTGTTTETVRPYTDLLLHDLGDGMADVTTREWRTAPLWGLRDGGPYLHDGRAASLTEVVLWHGGEGSAARERFRTAAEDERAALLAFLARL
jgi:CxxC motif-containing protein (DUF1111 family)